MIQAVRIFMYTRIFGLKASPAHPDQFFVFFERLIRMLARDLPKLVRIRAYTRLIILKGRIGAKSGHATESGPLGRSPPDLHTRKITLPLTLVGPLSRVLAQLVLVMPHSATAYFASYLTRRHISPLPL